TPRAFTSGPCGAFPANRRPLHGEVRPMKRVAMALALVAVVGVRGGAQEYANGDRQKLLGEWELVSLTVGGMENPGVAGNKDELRVRFTADKVVTFRGGKQLDEMPFKLDETKKPKRMEVGMGVNGAQGSKCIHQLDGDTLKIAMSPSKMNDPPASFDAKE